MYRSKRSGCFCAYEARKKHRLPKKRSCGKGKYADKVRRRQPFCPICHVKFEDVRLFECHLKSDEHKLNDAPLAFILQRIEQRNVEGDAPEYRILRRPANRQESEERRDDEQPLDISSMPLGAECISRVQVSFCGVCKIYIPDEMGEEGVDAHLRSLEHSKRMDAARMHSQ